MSIPRGFLPVTTFGPAFPLDALIQPFLSRFTQSVMVSYHYARQMPERFALPAFIDSGGFAALLPGSQVVELDNGLGVIEVPPTDAAPDTVHPADVLAFQVQRARYGCPLDFPVPPALTDPLERERRLRLTLANARYAIGAPRPERLTLFGCVQGWDEESYVRCARALLAMGYTHLAIGGLVPRLGDPELVESVVRAVRRLQADGAGLHLFGLGSPDNIARAFAWGATSTDSSSYVQAAANGKCWCGEMPADPSPIERAHAAVRNVSVCIEAALA